jgi:hypothetical protein
MNNLLHEWTIFSIYSKDMMFILNDKFMFGNTLCYDNVDDYDLFKL